MAKKGLFCCFRGCGLGMPRSLRGRSSQVKGAYGVAARWRCAPPWTCEPLRPLRAALQAGQSLPSTSRGTPRQHN
jgi:hypothetical protein